MTNQVKFQERKLGTFSYRKNSLFGENVSISDIIHEVGTPTYIYSLNGILDNFQAAHQALQDIDHLICYSAKANSHQAILKALIRKGAGIDIVSRGELYRAIQAGVDFRKVVFAGVGKREDEIRYALRNNILMFNVESLNEIRKINEVAAAMGKKAQIALRINPDVDAKTHNYITTGKKETKFGIPLYQVPEMITMVRQLSHITVSGIQGHIGSQILNPEPYGKALEKLLAIIQELRSQQIPIEYLNMGGGMGIQYEISHQPFTMQQWAELIVPKIKKMDLKLIIEPGRSIVGNNGILAVKIIYNKQGHNKKFLITDGAMNDLIRPSLYDGYHQIWPVEIQNSDKEIYDVVGPVCESGDFFGKDRELIRMEEGDSLAVMSAGAYGMAMAGTYNSRVLAAEVLIADDKYYVIRERAEIETLIEGEITPPVV